MASSDLATIQGILERMQAETKEAQEAATAEILAGITQQQELMKRVHEAITSLSDIPAKRVGAPGIASVGMHHGSTDRPDDKSVAELASGRAGKTKSVSELARMPEPSQEFLSILPGEVLPMEMPAVAAVHGDLRSSPSPASSFASHGVDSAFSESLVEAVDTYQARYGQDKKVPERISKYLRTSRAEEASHEQSHARKMHTAPHISCILAFDLEGPKQGTGIFESTTRHPVFEVGSAALILVSTSLIGAETDYQARNGGLSSKAYDAVGIIMSCLFTVELAIRILASGRGFLCASEDKLWNQFDSVMVACGVTEAIMQLTGTGASSSASGGRVLRILRIIRIARAGRIGRILKYAHTFKQIAYALQSSISTLFCVCVMIFLIMYCFAVAICQAATFHLAELDDQHDMALKPAYVTILKTRFGNVHNSIMTLFMSITGGMNWGEAYQPIEEFSALYALLFILYVGLVFFGVLNIVTAIFVDSAMQSNQHHKELLIQDRNQKHEMYNDHLKEVFRKIDANNWGYVTQDEVEYFLEDEQLRLHLDSIDIFPNDARTLFHMLDADESGKVCIEEFCDGCLRLKGEAKAYDIHCLLLMTRSLTTKLNTREAHMINSLETLSTHLGVSLPTVEAM